MESINYFTFTNMQLLGINYQHLNRVVAQRGTAIFGF